MSPPTDPTRGDMPRDLRPMLAVASDDVPRDDEHWAFEMKWDGMRALLAIDGGTRPSPRRQGNDATVALPGAASARRGARQHRRGARRRDRAARRRRSSELRAAPTAHARELGVGGAAARRRAPGRRDAVRRAVARRPLDARAPVHRSPRSCSTSSRSSGPTWQTPPTTIGGGDAVAARRRATSAWRASSPSGSTAPTSRAPLRRVAQGEDRPGPGAGRRRLAPRRGPPRRAARLAARRVLRRRRHAAVRGPGRAPGSTRPPARGSSSCWRRSCATPAHSHNTPKLKAPTWVEPTRRRGGGVPRVDAHRACCGRRATRACARQGRVGGRARDRVEHGTVRPHDRPRVDGRARPGRPRARRRCHTARAGRRRDRARSRPSTRR